MNTAPGFASRAAAFVLDLAVVGAAGALSLWLARLAATVLLARLRPGPELYTLGGPTALLLLAVAYNVGAWTLFGATLGKALLGLRVVGPDGKPPRIGRALLRCAGYWLSAVPFMLGFLAILVDPQRRAWHDRLAKTSVVRATTVAAPPLVIRERRLRA